MELTCVSGYWPVENKHGDKYNDWFKYTLRINAPYIFFVNKKGFEIIKEYRKDLPTHYIEFDIPKFYTYKYKNKMKTDSVHCPSVELNLIWNEKIFFIQRAFESNPFDSNYFIWIDAGICTFRDTMPPSKPFPNKYNIKFLPKNKFIYSSSQSPVFDNRFISDSDNQHLYHHVSGTYILHKDIINNFTELYKKYFDNLVDGKRLWTDQVILTHIYKDHSHMFCKICDGYGTILKLLY